MSTSPTDRLEPARRRPHAELVGGEPREVVVARRNRGPAAPEARRESTTATARRALRGAVRSRCRGTSSGRWRRASTSYDDLDRLRGHRRRRGRSGVVRDVLMLPSVDCLEVERGRRRRALLVPLVGDAVRALDVAGRRIDVDLAFLEPGSAGAVKIDVFTLFPEWFGWFHAPAPRPQRAAPRPRPAPVQLPRHDAARRTARSTTRPTAAAPAW